MREPRWFRRFINGATGALDRAAPPRHSPRAARRSTGPCARTGSGYEDLFSAILHVVERPDARYALPYMAARRTRGGGPVREPLLPDAWRRGGSRHRDRAALGGL